MSLDEQNRSNVDVFRKARYRSSEQWYDKEGEPFYPQINYAVGGNTKIYGSALLRFRERDFETVEHQTGISPEWPLKYADFEPYYTEAEELYQVHGQIGPDPTEPAHSRDYPFEAVNHHPQVASILPIMQQQGLHPTAIPMGITGSNEDPTSDSEFNALNLALKHSNVSLKTGAKVVALHTNSSGNLIKALQAEIKG
jgi:choline dehydrogenase-like flavoprotein